MTKETNAAAVISLMTRHDGSRSGPELSQARVGLSVMVLHSHVACALRWAQPVLFREFQ